MRPKRLVIDANILIRAVLGSRVRGLIEHYCNSVAFYIAEANAEEAEFYLSKELAAKRGLGEEVWRPVSGGVLNTVQIIADDVLIEAETEAKARIASHDVNDLGAGVATWTTAASVIVTQISCSRTVLASIKSGLPKPSVKLE